MAKQNFTDISVVLDRSGSMASVAHDTIGGFNRFLDDQEKVAGEAVITLVQFDNVYEKLYEAKPLSAAPRLNSHTFVPRGSTALLDAIGRLVDETGKRLANMPEGQRPGQIVFVILTDGFENSSCKYDMLKINVMITHQRDVYKWNFMFLGANQDAIATAAGLGISSNVAMTYGGTGEGTGRAIQAASTAVGAYRASGQSLMSSSRDYFAGEREEQQKIIKEAEQYAPKVSIQRKKDK